MVTLSVHQLKNILPAVPADVPGFPPERTLRRPPAGRPGAGTWTLALAGIDLSSLYTSLVATRLSGRIGADLGILAQDSIDLGALEFRAHDLVAAHILDAADRDRQAGLAGAETAELPSVLNPVNLSPS